MLNFWGPKKDKKVINSSTKCLISVKIAVMTPHIIPLPLVNVWLIFDLQKYVNWLCVFSKVNPFFQKAQVFCMDLQPAADPYNVVCKQTLHTAVTIATLYRRSSNMSRILKLVCYYMMYAVIISPCGKLWIQTWWKTVLAALTKSSNF